MLCINHHLARGLRRIYMHQNALFAADRANRIDVLNHTNFVIHQQDRHQNRIGPQRSFESIQVEQAICLHIKISDIVALTLQLTHGVQRRFMFRLERDEMFAAALVESGSAFEGEVGRFSRTASPDNLSRVSVNQGSHVLTRFFHRFLCSPAISVTARTRVAVIFV
jgi:hypothetical protein